MGRQIGRHILHIRKKNPNMGKRRRTSYEKKQVVGLDGRSCQYNDDGRDEHGAGAGRS